MDQIDEIIRILKVSPDDRQQEDINTLLQLTKDIQFFKYYFEQGKTDIHKKCCKCMVLEQHQERSVVFNIGTIGYKFYIILEGEVGVYIKNKKSNAPTIDFEKLMQLKPRNKLQKVARILKSQNYKLETENSVMKEANTIGAIFEKALKNQIQKYRQQSLQLSRFNTVEGDFVQVSTLKAGSSFGELALINDRPRLATIVCSQNCKFAVIDKDNFQRILKEQEEIKLIKALNLYSSIPLFENFSTYLLKQVHWSSFKVKYKMNEKVFAQGEESDCMYIVNSGQFLIFQKFEQSTKTAIEEEEMNNLNDEQFFNSYKIQPQGKKKAINTNFNYIEGTDIKIAQLLPYQLIGEEDLFEGSKRSYNVICTSLEGELIRIKLKEFKQKILNDVGAHQYLTINVPKKRKLYEEKILHQKTIIINNIQLISSKQPVLSLQTKLQNGKIEEAQFFNQKLVVPSSQIKKQNFLNALSTNSSSKRCSDQIPISSQSPQKKVITSQSHQKETYESTNLQTESSSTSYQRKSGIINNFLDSGQSVKTQQSNTQQGDVSNQLNINAFGQNISSPNRPLSSKNGNQHEALKQYFLSTGDPLLRSCFQDEINVQNQGSSKQQYKKEMVLENIFKHQNKNPGNHKYHPTEKMYNQPIKEDYVNVNGNIRQVLKYRNPTENSVGFILKYHPSEKLPTEPTKSNRTITFIPTNIEESSPVSINNKRGVKTMVDLGPADLVNKVEPTINGIRSSRMIKMKKMIKVIDKQSQNSNSTNKPIELTGNQSSLIKYKAISVNTFSQLPKQNMYKSQTNLHNNQESTQDMHTSSNKANYKSSNSIKSLQDLGNFNQIHQSQYEQNILNIQKCQSKYTNNSSQSNIHSNYGYDSDRIQTDRSKSNQIYLLQSSPIKSSNIRRHTDKVINLSSHQKDSFSSNIIIEENQNNPSLKPIFTPNTQKNINACKIISDGSQILKDIIKNNNQLTKSTSNKNNQNRVLVSQQGFRKSDIVQNLFYSPQKRENQTNKKKILFSFTNLNNIISSMEMATQTDMDPISYEENNYNLNNIHSNQQKQ
ncbi:cyclic nucleotide-binding domain protein (macronuclear) [Tetrahymena thermophila SB210]|uniref:Cyclic nucleotide-binding domain protein n=1 Tax=Tetrahymena thermophila (strain SB210) TaxID=312017 RepID=I7MI54_TETTS|nr:cyclic nucleotide-binding domain protein [Tetrahymena thermophila SB210]EAR90895.2 cyclic nucleotide-binding domain protein [Tetrahymena thermophila SB210]|eukprot:XP_001011140.2 cyclic nucleotide-binding domain protein [Tetrahymena thermophila SB210]